MAALALTAARFLGRSRKLAIFGGLVAIAGLVNELQRRKERGSNLATEA
ncbi:MAG: hypothetical protein ACJ75Q_13780 [Gaiellaceae bacterium]